jgi:hypothetical protein
METILGHFGDVSWREIIEAEDEQGVIDTLQHGTILRGVLLQLGTQVRPYRPVLCRQNGQRMRGD